MSPQAQPIMERIWAKVDVCGPDECWPWTGAKLPRGYGTIGGSQSRERGYVCRFILEEKLGRTLGEGMKACHTCDNPPCCNPNHLFEGTQATNMQDMVVKGRSNTGECHWNARLTEAQVAAIRQDSRPSTVVGEEYGVQPRQIRRIRQGVRW